MTLSFNDRISDFYQYLLNNGYRESRTKTNYLSWLKFLSNYYSIDDSLSEEKIEAIFNSENEKRILREKYKRTKDVSDFRSALRKYLEFLNADIDLENEKILKHSLKEIQKDNALTVTQKETIVKSRIGQGQYRTQLINYWRASSINNYSRISLLVASHIKPWKLSSNTERIDYFNGLLLTPSYDKLFDKGLISFDSKGKIIISKFLHESDMCEFNISTTIKLRKVEEPHINYLEYHNKNIFIN